MVLMNLFTEQQWRYRLMDKGGGEEGEDPELTAKPYLQQQRRGSKLKVHPGAVEPHVSGSTISFPFLYNCDQYFVPPSQYSSDYLTCTAEGWSPEELCLRECIFNNLENVYTPSSERKAVQGETVRVRCYHGYSLQNNQNTMTCTESGWSPPPRCIRVNVSCVNPPQVENAIIHNQKSRYQSGERARYESIGNYDLFGEIEVICLNGIWTEPPQCKDSQGKCGPPPPIDNGDITSLLQSVYPPGSIVEYRCQAYYELQGNRNVVCQNGEWSEPPKCLEACVISEETMRKHHIQLRWK
ncbi:complement factor H-related protein 1-like [Bos indicus x Bos taurus]|uniref:complement factor H-related protein 1-like n=1 Tax=Bos indicus x Bos taurus TaxID=30522 RepID=UPI000F7D35EC|nr:complement factor H-related protein 1-like [Bos indicus x Bos taurus]